MVLTCTPQARCIPRGANYILVYTRLEQRGRERHSCSQPCWPCLGPTPAPTLGDPLTFFALLAHPAIHAGLVAVLVTGVVTEEVIAGPAELVAGRAVVVLITTHPDLQLQMCHVAAEVQALPAVLRVDHAGVRHPFNQQLLFGSSTVSQRHRLPVGPRGCGTGLPGSFGASGAGRAGRGRLPPLQEPGAEGSGDTVQTSGEAGRRQKL